MADGIRRKFAVLGVSSLILVAMVVALTFHSGDTGNSNHYDVSSSVKSIKTICQSTDYQETCVENLSSAAGNTSDTKDLIKAAFSVAIKKIQEAANHSSVLLQLQKDPRTKEALKNCEELAGMAVNDLNKSFNKLGDIDFSQIDEVIDTMKIWLSGAITYQETCLDGFEDTSGDAGEKMKAALKTGMELTSNGLAMVTDISLALSSLKITKNSDHRLLFNEVPDWVDEGNRRLLKAKPSEIKPDLTVAKDGSGKYKTINEALKDIPKKGNKTFVLYIKEGVYEEKVQFNSSMTHLMVIGDGPTKTRITGKLNFIDGVATFHTATVAVLGDYFIAKDIGFENAAGPEKHQAVALRVGADMSIFYNCHMDGYQDTLYAHTYRQYYRDCVISGTIDFIFGDSAAFFQNCTMVVRKPLDNQQCIVTAQGRKEIRQPTGLVLQNCTIVADPAYYPVRNKLKSYLGRPWKAYSRTIIMESYIDDLIPPLGWLPWNETFALETLFYSEFNNRGPGSNKLQRVKWPGIKELKSKCIQLFTAAKFIEGDTWIPSTGVPYNRGFIFPRPKENPTASSQCSPEEEKDLNKKKEKNSYSSRPDLVSETVNFGAPSPAPSVSPAFAPEMHKTAPALSPDSSSVQLSGKSWSLKMLFGGI